MKTDLTDKTNSHNRRLIFYTAAGMHYFYLGKTRRGISKPWGLWKTRKQAIAVIESFGLFEISSAYMEGSRTQSDFD